jgi:hypothetical protein
MHMYFPPEEFFKKRDSFWKILVGETKKKKWNSLVVNNLTEEIYTISKVEKFNGLESQTILFTPYCVRKLLSSNRIPFI